MSDAVKLLPCPKCGREIDVEENVYIPERDWHPTLYDPDSGGNPIYLRCPCGIEFETGTYEWDEFAAEWNKRST